MVHGGNLPGWWEPTRMVKTVWQPLSRWEAARQIDPTSLIRVATDQEKKLAQMAFSSEQSGPGLQVRECLADNILSLLHKIRTNAEYTYQVNALKGLWSRKGQKLM